jgi:dGTPase
MGMIPNKTGDDIGLSDILHLFSRSSWWYLLYYNWLLKMELTWTSIRGFCAEYLIKLVKDSIDSKHKTLETKKEDRISYLRALAIGSLINDAVKFLLKMRSHFTRKVIFINW